MIKPHLETAGTEEGRGAADIASAVIMPKAVIDADSPSKGPLEPVFCFYPTFLIESVTLATVFMITVTLRYQLIKPSVMNLEPRYDRVTGLLQEIIAQSSLVAVAPSEVVVNGMDIKQLHFFVVVFVVVQLCGYLIQGPVGDGFVFWVGANERFPSVLVGSYDFGKKVHDAYGFKGYFGSGISG